MLFQTINDISFIFDVTVRGTFRVISDPSSLYSLSFVHILIDILIMFGTQINKLLIHNRYTNDLHIGGDTAHEDIHLQLSLIDFVLKSHKHKFYAKEVRYLIGSLFLCIVSYA